MLLLKVNTLTMNNTGHITLVNVTHRLLLLPLHIKVILLFSTNAASGQQINSFIITHNLTCQNKQHKASVIWPLDIALVQCNYSRPSQLLSVLHYCNTRGCSFRSSVSRTLGLFYFLFFYEQHHLANSWVTNRM